MKKLIVILALGLLISACDHRNSSRYATLQEARAHCSGGIYYNGWGNPGYECQ